MADPRASRLVPCALYSGHYHLGVGALANSLYRNGFRGTMLVGYRPPLPPWAGAARADGAQARLTVAPGFEIVFMPWPSERNYTYEKARLLLHVLDRFAPDCDGAVVFDADIVIHGRWDFFEHWLSQGVALCLDICYPIVPAGHPWRADWRELAAGDGVRFRDLDFYANGGFVGLTRAHRALAVAWQRIIDAHLTRPGVTDQAIKLGGREDPVHAGDQDLLNAALMATDVPLSMIGQEGMDFIPGGYTMSHAIDAVKPWRRNYLLSALAGRPPTAPEKAFWRSVDGPIPLFGRFRRWRTRAAIRLASLIGRFYARG